MSTEDAAQLSEAIVLGYDSREAGGRIEPEVRDRRPSPPLLPPIDPEGRACGAVRSRLVGRPCAPNSCDPPCEEG